MDSICQYFKMYFPLENHEFCCPIIHLGLLKTCNCKSCNVYHINWYLIVSINLETKVFPKFWSFSCHNLPNQNVSPIKTARLSTAHCNLVMSRPCRKACILIKKAGTFDGWFFSRNFVCFKSISPKKQIYFRVYKRTLKQNPRKILVWTNQWHMISCDRVQQAEWWVWNPFLSNHFARFFIPPLRLGISSIIKIHLT